MRNKNIEEGKNPKLIEDLGMRKFTENSKEHRFGKFECLYCGNNFECRISSVTNGETRSCGCIRGKSILTHGLESHRFYPTWNALIQRCTNPKNKKYMDYGGRGITVCEEWLDVTNFVEWCESTHPNIKGYSLDRIDNDKGYSPENCRWADRTTQNTNQRLRRDNTSGFTGITKKKYDKSWLAQIRILNINKHIGSFPTKEEAVIARDNYIIENNLPHKLSTDYNRN